MDTERNRRIYIYLRVLRRGEDRECERESIRLVILPLSSTDALTSNATE